MEEDEVDLRDYFNIINKRKWLIAVLVVVALVISLTLSFRSPRVYEAKTTIKISSSLDAEYKTAVNVAAYINSDVLPKRLIEEKALNSSLDDLNITATPILNTNFVDIAVSHKDPRKAQVAANLVAELFIKEDSGSSSKNAKGLDRFLKNTKVRVETAKKRIKETNDDLLRIQTTLSQFDTEKTLTSESYALRLGSLENEFLMVKRMLYEQESTFAYLESEYFEKSIESARMKTMLPKVIAKADLPAEPASSNIFSGAIVASLLALIIGIGLALILEYSEGAKLNKKVS